MAIVGRFKVGEQSLYRSIGSGLRTLAFNHFVQFDGLRKIGFGYDCCNAAVAIENNEKSIEQGVTDGTNTEPFVALYGSSRMFTGMDPEYNLGRFGTRSPTKEMIGTAHYASSKLLQHAEQTAIVGAEGRGLTFWTDQNGYAHIYVDFAPCRDCATWLDTERTESWIVHYVAELTKVEQSEFKLERRAKRQQEFGTFSESKHGKYQ